MHNNYYFLRQLSGELEKRLVGCVVSECFSQSKEELIIRFETYDVPFFIKASLLSSFSCLSFPENFQRARKNSVDLFESLIGQRLIAVRQFENERSFALKFTNDITLLFKMHGNRANIILFEKEVIVNLFKNSIEQDTGLELKDLDRTIDWSFENFLRHRDNIQQVYFTFGKIPWRYLEQNNFGSKNEKDQWQSILELEKKLHTPTYYVTSVDGSIILSLIEIGSVLKTFTSAVKAVTEFYYKYTQTYTFDKEKHNALSLLKVKLQNSKAYIEKTYAKYKEVEQDSNYKVWADLIMANMHAIKPRTEKVILENFYHDNQPTEIKLKKDFSPQKNAEIYYRKSKNQQIEIDRLEQAIQAKEKEIISLHEKISAIESAEDLKTLRNLISDFGLVNEKQSQEIILPYHAVEFNGYNIWIGKNAKANDLLTLKYSFKEDLWLHAKDVAGSHVLIKYKAGKNFPKDVIERGAQLAAYYSKRKNETLCPVIVTPKKFVRKRKGDPACAVVVEREEVIMVEPRDRN